ncbi:C40 family peptidase [Streptomyces sp. NPDC098789]|uniref:C40 family peptidase n=1 Tax=Streptomyces sp. NPDC098789 TaxID=3366098 RepID=UPI00382E755A
MNLGVATGILGSIVAAAPASAAERPRSQESGDTRETATVGSVLTDRSALSATTRTIDRFHQDAQRFEIEGAEDRAAASASARARVSKAEARQATEERAAAARQQAAKAAAQQTPGRGGSGAAAPKGSLPPAGLSKVADFARGKVGSAYVYGASSGSAFDCSGLVQAAYRAAGISVPRTSQEQARAYSEVKGELRPGDILYWGSKDNAHHVAIYIGGGKFVGAQNPAAGVQLRDMTWSTHAGAVRPG